MAAGVKPLLHTGGAEVAGGEVVERLESANQFGAGYTALTIESAQKIGGGALALAGVAFEAARDQVCGKSWGRVGRGVRRGRGTAFAGRRSAARTVSSVRPRFRASQIMEK